MSEELHFAAPEDIGCLYVKEGKLYFEGDIDKSAEVFIETINEMLKRGNNETQRTLERG